MTQQTDPIVEAWQEAVQAEVRTRPWFAALLLQKGNQLLARFVHFYARLTAVGQRTRRRVAVGIGIAALALALSSAPTPAHAATITVGPGCNLVQAIISANTDAVAPGSSCTAGSGPDTIVLAGGTYSYNTANEFRSALPHITTPIIIEANGATIQRTADGDDMRIITINSGGSLTLNNATITGGNVSTSGGGIYVDSDSTLIINNSTISGNTAGGRGGGISNISTMTSTLNNSTVSGNTATSDGGGINKSGAGTLILNNSTVSDNTSTGGAGGGIHNFSSTISLNRSIVSGNTASTNREINITGSGATANVDNFNIIGHSNNSGSNVAINSPTVVPSGALNTVLSPLANNGGPTLTHALVTGSPAIDIAPAAACSGAPINGLDQRGVVRSQDGNADGTAACDAGAVEMGQLQCGIQVATEPTLLTFAQASNVFVDVTDDGTNLDCVRVTEIGHDHPNATSSMSNMALETGRYWQIAGLQNSISATPATANFTVNLTLPFAGADVNGDNRACKWLDGVGPGFGWDCGDDADNEEVTWVSVTRLNYTGGFSDWAVGDEVGPTAVANLHTQINTPSHLPHVPLLATLLTLLTSAWLWLTRSSTF